MAARDAIARSMGSVTIVGETRSDGGVGETTGGVGTADGGVEASKEVETCAVSMAVGGLISVGIIFVVSKGRSSLAEDLEDDIVVQGSGCGIRASIRVMLNLINTGQ
jgi:hypothetical protein